MQRDPAIPVRRSVRLPKFDYSNASAYFVTICSHKKKHIFGTVIEHRNGVSLTALGQIVDNCWMEIARHFSHVDLGPHVVMPNHLHGVIVIPATAARGASVAKQSDRARHAVPLQPDAAVRRFGEPDAGSIPTIVGAFKSAVTKIARVSLFGVRESIWQRGYYDRVIRTGKEFGQVCEYIRLNPARWESDEENSRRTRQL
jgi:putative transposase